MFFPPGKLPNPVLERMLERIKGRARDPRVVVGPRIGEDAAVLDFGDIYLVVATDPITFATEQLGWYAVQVNANDVAVRGARPRWFLAVLLLPEHHTDESLVTTIFDQIGAACGQLGCTLIGGHTEITLGIDRPIVVGQMMGEVAREKLVTSAGAQVGDVLLLTKGIAIEGTALLAREIGGKLLKLGVSEHDLERARSLLHQPGLSVVPDALIAIEAGAVHAMHDPTEGGLATGIAELAQASGVGAIIEATAVPILPECERICDVLGLDPLGTLASGALLLALAPGEADKVCGALAQKGIRSSIIGTVAPRESGLRLKKDDQLLELPAFARDEVARVLEG